MDGDGVSVTAAGVRVVTGMCDVSVAGSHVRSSPAPGARAPQEETR